MKSAMPYHGVPTPAMRKICKAVFADLPLAAATEWRAQVLEIWRRARFREERYAALYLAGDKRALPFQTPSAVTMYEELIVTGAWWDYVDDIASHRIGRILRDYPAPMRKKMLVWSKSRRSLEASHRDPLPTWIQGGNGSGTALRLHRTLSWIARVLSAQGDRLGIATICLDRRERNSQVCAPEWNPPERIELPGGAEEYRLSGPLNSSGCSPPA